MNNMARVLFALAAGALCAFAAAQAPPAAQDPQPERAQPDLPSLDELLGTGDAGRTDAGADALDARLLDQQQDDPLMGTLDLMKQAASRLEEQHDTGLGTQRIQETVLARLDKMIKDAREREQQQRQQQQQQQQQQGQQQNQPNQQQPQEGQRNQNQTGENQRELLPPGMMEGDVNSELARMGARWGFLPQRVRDALSQGSSDTFSSLYRSATEAYYRKIAEESGGRRP